VIGSPEKVDAFPFLTKANMVFQRDGVALWRLDRVQAAAASLLHCAGTPNAG
jgi:hypothetical protein